MYQPADHPSPSIKKLNCTLRVTAWGHGRGVGPVLLYEYGGSRYVHGQQPLVSSQEQRALLALLISRGPTAGCVPQSIIIGFRLFVLLGGHPGDVPSMPCKVRGTVVFWAGHPVLPDSAPPPRRAPRPDPPVVCPGFGLDRCSTKSAALHVVCMYRPGANSTREYPIQFGATWSYATHATPCVPNVHQGRETGRGQGRGNQQSGRPMSSELSPVCGILFLFSFFGSFMFIYIFCFVVVLFFVFHAKHDTCWSHAPACTNFVWGIMFETFSGYCCTDCEYLFLK